MKTAKGPANVLSLQKGREDRKRRQYADLVLQKFDEMAADDKREEHQTIVERKNTAHFAAKNRF